MPKRAIQMWTGERTTSPAVLMGARGLGGRDMVIGAGILISLEEGKGAREWLQASAVADASDAVGTLTSFKNLPKGRGAPSARGGGWRRRARFTPRRSDRLGDPLQLRAQVGPEGVLSEGHRQLASHRVPVDLDDAVRPSTFLAVVVG